MTTLPRTLIGLVASGLLALGSCGLEGPNPLNQGSGANVITISNFSFSPQNLDVAPGDTVTVKNLDPDPHSVTSQARPRAFVSGSVNGVAFDTGQFSAGTRTFAIPSGAPHGTIVPYFCSVHTNAMANDAQITIK